MNKLKPGVFDFFPDWSDAILTDLNQLRNAVDQVLGIAPPIEDINALGQQIDNVDYRPRLLFQIRYKYTYIFS